MPAAIMSDNAITMMTKEKHLRVPGIGAKRPSVREQDCLARSPILVINLCAIFRSDEAHLIFSLWNRIDRCLARTCNSRDWQFQSGHRYYAVESQCLDERKWLRSRAGWSQQVSETDVPQELDPNSVGDSVDDLSSVMGGIDMNAERAFTERRI